MIEFMPIIILLIYVLIFGFIAYFLAKVMLFMKNKNHNDKVLIQKVDELSKELKKQNDDVGRR